MMFGDHEIQQVQGRMISSTIALSKKGTETVGQTLKSRSRKVSVGAFCFFSHHQVARAVLMRKVSGGGCNSLQAAKNRMRCCWLCVMAFGGVNAQRQALTGSWDLICELVGCGCTVAVLSAGNPAPRIANSPVRHVVSQPLILSLSSISKSLIPSLSHLQQLGRRVRLGAKGFAKS